MSDRLFDRQNYSAQTLEIFEIMSSYFVDIFYNHLYIEAKKLKAGGTVTSITEGYKHTLNAFIKGMDNPKLYKKSIVGIHNYFIAIGFASISFSKCVDKLTKEFVPSDYYNSLTVTQKMGVLRMVLNQSLKTFIRKIVDEHMAKIIDFHQEKDNVRVLQDDLIDCFLLEREGMYQRFIAENTKTNKNETVNRLIAEKMQNEIKRLVKEKYAQQKTILILKKLVLQKSAAESKLKVLIGELTAEIESLKMQQQTSKFQTEQFFERQRSAQSYVDRTNHNSKPPTRNEVSHKLPDPPIVDSASIKNTHTSEQDNHSTKKEIVEEDSIVTNTSMFDSDDEESGTKFIEVNTGNILDLIESDSEHLQKINNTKMDEGTMLDDFA